MGRVLQFRVNDGAPARTPADWVPASALRALILEDPCLVWLEHHGHRHGFAEDTDDYSFLEMIGHAGSRFEEDCVRHLAPEAVRVLAEDWEVRDRAAFEKTVTALQAGHDVLTKCALWGDDGVRVFGTADIVARQSWVFRRFPRLRPLGPADCSAEDGSAEDGSAEDGSAEDGSAEDPYVILDCKNIGALESKPTDLRIASAQVRLYSYLLGRLQGVMPDRAYIITRDRPEDPIPVDVGMTLGGPLDPDLAALCELYRHIKLDGAKYRPWVDSVVGHNHSNHKTEPWTGAVKRITELIPGGSLERLPGVGRQQAEALRHFGFDCLADVLHPDAAGFPFHAVRGIGGRKADILSAVVDANRTGRPTPFPASAVPAEHAVEIYVDYETLSSICGGETAGVPPEDGPGTAVEGPGTAVEGGEIVFMVGCGWIDRGKWHYRQFTAAGHSEADEREMLGQFLAWLEARGALAEGASAALYHWSPAEVSFSRRAAERLGLTRLGELPWVDLLQVFKGVPIGIPHSFGYGLKEVGRALGEFDRRYAVEWPSGLNGLAALVAGARMYEQEDPLGSPEFEILTRYLHTDVKALHEVLRFLRDHGAQEQPAANGCPNVDDVITVEPAADGPDSRRVQGSRRGWYALATGRGG